jgi:cellulose biosynthesis protein BcsQ
MKIVVFNLKGGQGKTSIAVSLALHYKTAIITNDSCSRLELILPKTAFKEIGTKEKEIPNVDDVDIIYDFGGWLDLRIISILKTADLVIIPIIFNGFLDLQKGVQSINEVLRYNKNILVIVNATKGKDYTIVKSSIMGIFDKLPIIEIKKTTAFSKIFEMEKNIEEIIEKNKLLAHSYKNVQEQLNILYNFIKENVIK